MPSEKTKRFLEKNLRFEGQNAIYTIQEDSTKIEGVLSACSFQRVVVARENIEAFVKKHLQSGQRDSQTIIGGTLVVYRDEWDSVTNPYPSDYKRETPVQATFALRKRMFRHRLSVKGLAYLV